jgi:DNA processing protein
VSACADCLAAATRRSPPVRRPRGDVWTVCSHDRTYPRQLGDLDHVADLQDAPPVLFGCGLLDALASAERRATVTIVGSRRATPYGLAVARQLARDLAAAGLVVVSGLAYGIDAAVHSGALESGGTTIAVLAGGPDVVYPARAVALYRRILERGAAISERPPGTVPERWSFPTRNRIMAAVAEITVVVEAAQPSGSTITANHAAKLGRTIGAVPGPINSRVSAGTIELLSDGAALIARAEDVLDRLYGVGVVAAARVGPTLDPELEPVLAAVETGAGGPDAIAARTRLTGREVAVALTRLELLGYLRSDLAGSFSRTALQPPASTMRR